MTGRLGTGVEALDRRLNGGLPEGGVVLLSAAPASQSELFLYQLTAARPTHYLTTVRSDRAVREALDRTDAPTGDPAVRTVDGPAPLDAADEFVGAVPEGAVLVVDVVDVLERREFGPYRAFLERVREQVVGTGGVAVLHGLDGRSVPENRDVTEHVADVVLDLRTAVAGSEVENRLAVPKYRGEPVPEETIKLTFADGITVDTSRDIA